MKRWVIVRKDIRTKEPVLETQLYETREKAEKDFYRWSYPVGAIEVEIPSKVRPFKVGDVTKDGQGNTVRIICTDKKVKNGMNLVALKDCGEFENTIFRHPSGRYALGYTSINDLEPMYEYD